MKSIVLTPRLERLIFPAVELRYKGYTLSLLMSGSKILSIGRNITIAPHSKFRPLPSIHAELDAIRKCRLPTTNNKKKIIMMIVRQDKSGSWKNCRPCAHCIETLQKNRISQIIYSNQEGKFTTEKVCDMNPKTAHVSLGWQKIQKLI